MGFAPEEIVVWTGAASRVGLRSHLGLVPGTRDPLTFQITFRATRLEMNTILTWSVTLAIITTKLTTGS